MEPVQNKPYRVNPVEMAIFSVVTLVLCNSFYSLVYDSQGAVSTALVPMAANPVSESRAPAATAFQAFSQLELKCDNSAIIDTSAQKVRLVGNLCGLDQTIEDAVILKSQITNTANRYTATVFTDLSRGRFSTDYIPLTSGQNTLRVEFVYPDGKTFSQTFAVNKL